ncbi:DUF262 domain-containing protein [Microbispora sp. ZYX-F-249]|uniref:DUF262 domain-containing protein n=1 Tax=Microbispora maris TaxID=3144104 RepID=A0ABV0ATS6_9ACTN
MTDNGQDQLDFDVESGEPVELDQEDVESLQEADPEPARVSYTGSDFDAEGLVRRLKRGDIVIPTFGHPEDPPIETARFQRDFVWRRPQMDRFIESLLLGYPIPGIFLVQQVDRRYLVLDGQQRLRTLAAFYEGLHEKREFALRNVATKFQGLTYRTLTPEVRRTLDNTFIQATIVQTDGSTDSLDAVYQVFERLNSGGTQLTPHEIRVALYAGDFIDLLTELNADPNWRNLYGRKSPRLRDQEVILRIIALYTSPGTYKRPLKKFLNDFVGQNRDLESLSAELVETRFRLAAQLINEGAGPRALRRQSAQINTALTEAIFVGLIRRLDADASVTAADVGQAIERLLGNKRLEPAISRATADEESVRTRLAVTTQAFAAI